MLSVFVRAKPAQTHSNALQLRKPSSSGGILLEIREKGKPERFLLFHLPGSFICRHV
jgi:hypothetical protein